jgi:PAS domain S-box-containing protein
MDIFSDDIKIENLATAKQFFMECKDGFLKLFNNSPVCMSMTSPERKYVRVNKKFLEKFGYSESEIIGRSSVEIGILDPEESIKVGLLIKEKGRLQNDSVKCIAKDGTIVHTISSIEFMEMNGETYLVSFFIDISKIIEQQTIIEQHAQQLQAINKDLEAFSYSVSHDLHAPLRAINGYTQILKDDFIDSLGDEGKRILSAVQNNAQKMARLIDDLLAFSKLGKKEIIKRQIDMTRLVDEVLSDLKKNTHHQAEIKVGLLLPAMGDYALIALVVTNLVSNAVKYSSKREKPEVEISSEQGDNEVRYIIKDNGEGFDMKYAEKLFGVFQRLHSEKDFEGTGVGLAIVNRIVSRHGGKVQADAVPGKGATFSFTLPVN